jgi:hypothetical protein
MQTHTRRSVQQAFPSIRSLRTPETMNEVLIAGAKVATRARLDTYASAFSDWRDRSYWDLIEVRKLT